MLYFKIKTNADGSIEVTDILSSSPMYASGEWTSRWHIKTLSYADRIAEAATKQSGKPHIGVDNGPAYSPRYDVVEAPAIGDDVSYGFNGDYYPDGKIIHVTKGSMRVIKTSTGNTYYRHKNSDKWVMAGGTWSLVMGTHNERNPCF